MRPESGVGESDDDGRDGPEDDERLYGTVLKHLSVLMEAWGVLSRAPSGRFAVRRHVTTNSSTGQHRAANRQMFPPPHLDVCENGSEEDKHLKAQRSTGTVGQLRWQGRWA